MNRTQGHELHFFSCDYLADSDWRIIPGFSPLATTSLLFLPPNSHLRCLRRFCPILSLPPCSGPLILPTRHFHFSNNELLEIPSVSFSCSHSPLSLLGSYLFSHFLLLLILHISAQKPPPPGSQSWPAPPWSASDTPLAMFFDHLSDYPWESFTELGATYMQDLCHLFVFYPAQYLAHSKSSANIAWRNNVENNQKNLKIEWWVIPLGHFSCLLSLLYS